MSFERMREDEPPQEVVEEFHQRVLEKERQKQKALEKEKHEMSIERGDIVHHAPTGEDWVILRSFTDACGKEFVEPAGWPRCQADASDCTVIKKGGALDFLDRNKEKSA